MYLPMLKRFISDLVMLTNSPRSIADAEFAPRRPVLLAAHLDLHAQDDFGIDTFYAGRLVVGQRAFDTLAVHQEAFNLAARERGLTMLQAFPAAGGVRLEAGAGHGGRREQGVGAAAVGPDVARPDGDHHRAVALAHAAAAPDRALQV